MNTTAKDEEKSVDTDKIETQTIEKSNNSEGLTQLHAAANQGDVDLARELIEKGANVNAVTNFWHTPLHYAVNRGGFAMVKLLLENGAKVNVLSNFDYAPLHYATSNGKFKVAELLIAKGASLNIQNTFGHTPLHLTANHPKTATDCKNCNDGRYRVCAGIQGRFEIAKLLIEKGAKLYLEDEDGNTALELARQFGYCEIVSLIEDSQLRKNKGS